MRGAEDSAVGHLTLPEPDDLRLPGPFTPSWRLHRRKPVGDITTSWDAA
jgi:hypothetical protein